MDGRHLDGQHSSETIVHRNGKTWEQLPWLSFESKFIEAEYRRHYTYRQMRKDKVTCTVLAFISAIIGTCSASWGAMAAATLSCVTLSALLCAHSQSAWSAALLQHRSALVIIIRLTTALAVSAAGTEGGGWTPAVLWAVLAGKVLHLGVLPLALQLPFVQHLVVQTAALAASLMGTPRDCVHILGQQGLFQNGRVLAHVAEVFNQVSHLLQAPLKLHQPTVPPEQACPCLLGSAHTILGFVLPSIVLYLLEAHDRGAFRQLKCNCRSHADFGCSILEITLISLLLLSLAAVIVWDAAVALVVHWH